MPPRTRRRKEEVEVRNQADQMVYQTREDPAARWATRSPPTTRPQVEAGIDKLKETLKGSDTAAIKAATEELTQAFYAVSEKLYQQARRPGRTGRLAQQPGGRRRRHRAATYYDADYKVVDDDDKNK